MVKIRLRSMGARHRRTYRFVAIESRNAREGRYLESLGHYDPRTKELAVDLERTDHWLKQGARLSNTAAKLVDRYRKQLAAPGKESVAELAADAAAAAGVMPEVPDAEVEQEEKLESPAEMAVAESAAPEAPAEEDTEPAQETDDTETTTDENEDVASSEQTT